MVKLEKRELKELQSIQMELLVEVDRICKKYEIRYNIIAGTLLGAVRHKGFIPWDDDADVAFLRPEYERFRNACVEELDEARFYFQDHRNTKGYRWGYGKLRRKDTVFLREFQEHMPYEQGVFIDIFPLDGVPDRIFKRQLHFAECFIVRKLLWSKAGKVADKKASGRMLFRILSLIPEALLMKYYDRLVDRSNRKESELVRILTFPTPHHSYGYLRRWYEESGEYVFEGQMFSGIKNYNTYLCFKFGDYMKLPPEEERKTHPVSRLKLLSADGGQVEDI